MNYPYFVWESISINVCNALLFNAFCSCRNQFLKELAYFLKSFFVCLFYRLPGKNHKFDFSLLLLFILIYMHISTVQNNLEAVRKHLASTRMTIATSNFKLRSNALATSELFMDKRLTVEIGLTLQ